KLDEIETVRSDGIVLDDVAAYYVTNRLKDMIVSYPCIFILGEETPSANRIGKKREFRHKIIIRIFSRDVEEEILQRKLWRYVEAVEKVLNQDETLAGAAIYSVITAHKYSPSYKAGMLFVKDASLLIEVHERYSVN
ncbi:MAG: hypothetical protein ACUZ77_07800, partial [Candidatus Brocadiales bacterium]